MRIDVTTDVNGRPNPVSIAFPSPIQVTLNGYEVAFLKLQYAGLARLSAAEHSKIEFCAACSRLGPSAAA